MKKIYPFVAALLLTAFLSIAAIAQQPVQAAQISSKVVIVNTANLFNDKNGITKLINANKQLDVELAPKRAELQQMVNRTQALQREVEALQRNVQNKIPIDQKAAQAKADELERMTREGKFKEDEYNKFVEKRQNEVLGPPYSDVLKGLEEFIRLKGYGIVFDVSKDQAGMLIFAGVQYDITPDFIAYYNGRSTTPATTPVRPATVVPPTKPPTKP